MKFSSKCGEESRAFEINTSSDIDTAVAQCRGDAVPSKALEWAEDIESILERPKNMKRLNVARQIKRRRHKRTLNLPIS